ncbi:polysaccharide pyruvyl transferase family protein [Labilibacter marinus]|uniref:polysaccharide pyruvyl transferase family protein n=1 Tax=Labilibacter marinus TaxID=1477105 RepID=UPI00082B1383|nr:polysaccharide pyruvyl transferase family protein [Labilibacter marinus]
MQKIIITGGNFINKGAQSMLFCLVDGLKKKYPQAEIVMVDIFPSLKGNKKEEYTFQVVNMHVRTILRMAFPILKLLVKPKPISNAEAEISTHFKSADLVLDISGYGVSSHNQKPIWTYATLFPVKLAKKYQVPFMFMPQSIGPFDFTGWRKMVVWPLIKKYLQYPDAIFIREPNCRKYLEKINAKKVIDSFDLVLQSEKIKADNIFKSVPTQNSYPISANSIVVIPNKQLTRITPETEIVIIFSNLIKHLIKNENKVVIARHSSDDKALCDLIYQQVKSEQVQLVNEDLNPLELQEIFESSKMVIAARYHGLIHALKMSKPCLVLGWANKYSHVMNTFNMSDYYFDIRTTDINSLIHASDQLLKELPQYSKQISTQLEAIKTSNIFNYINY